jgi:iron(III) transport system substrate-binding protein
MEDEDMGLKPRHEGTGGRGSGRSRSVVAVGLAAAVLAGCGGADAGSSTSTGGSAAATTTGAAVVTKPAPEATPVSDEVLAAAKREGSLVLYTNSEDDQIAPLVKAFNRTHPGIRVRSLSLGAEEIFQRYLSEQATGSPSADLLMANHRIGWQSLMKKGLVEPYEDPNVAKLPDYARLGEGVTAMSEDPAVVVYNKALIPEDQQPSTLAELAAMAPKLEGKLATVDIAIPLQLETLAGYVGKAGDAGWKTIEMLGAASKVESSTGSVVTKLAQGQYAAAFFVSGSVRGLITGDAAKLVSWKYLTDATVVVPRGIGIPKGGRSPNAAKVFLNWVLSAEGQQAECTAGFTPFRDGVDCPAALAGVTASVGADNAIVGAYEDDLSGERAAMTSRWKAAFRR